LDQQKAFLKAYAEHKPAFPWETPKPTPGPTTPAEVATEIFTRVNYEDSNLELAAEQQLSTNETTLPLAEDKSGESEIEREVEDLLLETRWWRMACSAQWIAWGIVQAPEFGEQEDSEGSEEFDYLAYSQERAMFYWGDCVRLGLVDPASLPEKLQRQLQFVEN
jgi:choline kinase